MTERSLRRRVFARSLLLQSCWSFEQMQGLGFLLGVEPFLRRLHPSPERYREAALRHLEPFNTQPYMAGFALGMVGGMEEDLVRLTEDQRPAAEERIRQMKRAFGAALAALGDPFFWGALRPACAAWAMLAWLVLWTVGVPRPALWAGLLYLAAFNAPALRARWRGVRLGLELREALVGRLAGERWHESAAAVRRWGLAAALALTASALLVPPWGSAAGPGNLVVFGAALALHRRGWSSAGLYAAAAAAQAALGAVDGL